MGLPAPLRPTLALNDEACAPASLDLVSARDDTRWLLENYALYGELGRGGMSTVYLATERATGRQVAIKVLDRQDEIDPDTESHFECEARSAALLRHPNIVETLAVGTYGGSVVAIVNAYVRGKSLRALLEESGPLPFDRATQILRDVAAALAHAHEARIVHCDVKPANILIEADTGRALLTDFGIACDLDAAAQRTTPGLTVGTPAYMSPEQITGAEVDERSDVYALGVVAWEMLAGAAPWQGESMSSVLFKQQYELLPNLVAIRPDIPAFLLNAINTALSKNKTRRQPTAAAFLAQLDPTPVPVEALASTDVDEVEDETAGATVRFTPVSREGASTSPNAPMPVATGYTSTSTFAPPAFAPPLGAQPVTAPSFAPRSFGVPAAGTTTLDRVSPRRGAGGRIVGIVVALWCALALGALAMSVFAPERLAPIVERVTGRHAPAGITLDSMLTEAATPRAEPPAGGSSSAACRTASARKTAACRTPARGHRSSAHRTSLHHTSTHRR